MGTDVNDMLQQANEQGIQTEQLKRQVINGIYEPHSEPTKGTFPLSIGWQGFDEQFSYLIKGYLPANSFGVVFGASGSYKSFHALSWAAHIALGIEWNGCKVNAAPVLYIAGEGGIGVKRRIKALANQYNEGKQIDNLYRIDFGVQVADKDQIGALIKTINEKADGVGEKFGLVIIDTLARSFGGADENQAKDMGAFIAACDQVKAVTEASLLVVHHSGHDKDRARGSSSLRAACDFEYRIKRTENETLAYVLTCTKSKDEKEPPEEMFTLASHELFTDSDGDKVCSLSALNYGQEPPAENNEQQGTKLSKNEQTLYQVVRSRMANRDSTKKALVRDDLKAQGMNISNFSKWLIGCVEKGVLIDREDELFTVIAADETN